MEYYLNIEGKQRGPLDISEFRELVKDEAVSPEDFVWDVKQSTWIKIKFHAELARAFEEESTLAEAAGEGFFINVEGKTGGPFPRDAIIKEIERKRFKAQHFVWDAVANRWLKASEHPLFSQFFTASGKTAAAKKYYLSKDGARFGPYEAAEVESKIRGAAFGRGHYIWEGLLKKWVRLGEVSDFADVFAELDTREPEVPPPMPASEPPPPTASLAEVPLAEKPAGGIAPPPSVRPAPTPPFGPTAPEPTVSFKPVSPIPPGAGAVGPPSPAAARATAPPAAPPRAPKDPEVGDLVTISPPRPRPVRPVKPAAVAPVNVDEVEFRKVAEDEEAPKKKGRDVKVDRSVVLDFAKPSLLKRVCAQLVDLFLVALCYFIVALIFSFLDMNPYMPGPDQYYFQQVFWATLGGVFVFYFLVRDAGGASFGKRVMGLRVVKYDDFNQRANLFQSVVRNVTLLLPLLNILEAVYVLTDVKGRRMGDRAVGTVVTEAHEIDYVRQQQSILDEVY